MAIFFQLTSREQILIITIDGLAGSGKSSVASAVAQRLGFIHLNSGLIYRTFAYFTLLSEHDLLDEDSVLASSINRKFDFTLKPSDLSTEFSVTGLEDVSFLHKRDIAQGASIVGTLPKVRAVSTDIQRSVANNNSVVLEGRDAGTVVFPNAEFKFYLSASVSERAIRRLREIYSDIEGTDKFNKLLSELVLELEERDNRDISREVSPHIIPEGSFEIVTDNFTFQEVVEAVISKVTPSLGNKV